MDKKGWDREEDSKRQLMRIMLINPPGSKTYLRDYHCSKVSKAGYVYHPVDLTFQSGILKKHHEVSVEDAIACRHSIEHVIERIKLEKPDAVLCLIGAVSWQEDRIFVSRLRREFGGKIIVTGDVFLDDPHEITSQLEGIDAVLTNFTSTGLSAYLCGEEATDMIKIRADGELEKTEKSPKTGSFSVPVPLYELFPNKKYHYPFVRRRPFATILTDYGCPFPCGYCIMSFVGYKTRPVDNVLEELHWLKSHGYLELYINDQTFGADKERCRDLLEAMAQDLPHFGWVCFTRADLLDENTANIMKKAGCHTVMLGVENASTDILKSYRKKVDEKIVKNAFDVARTNGIRTVATFLLGFPEDDAKSVQRTIELALELSPDFASFNFAVPRRATDIRRRALELGLVDPHTIEMDQAGETIAMRTKYLSKDEMAELRRKAIKSFYLRPAYILKRALSVRTFYEARTTVMEGMEVLKSVLGKKI